MGTAASQSQVLPGDGNCKKTEVKIALVGSYAVGKTSILNRFVWDKFSPAYLSTSGGNMQRKRIQIHGEAVLLQLIDTGGEEYQQDIIKTLYKKAHGIILVHDISKPQSFNDIDKLLKQIRSNCLGNPLIMLVGNKCDLDKQQQEAELRQLNERIETGVIRKYEPNYSELSRVPVEEIEKKVFSSENGFLKYYCEVSAKTRTNVDAMFEIFVKEIIHHNRTLVKDIWLNYEPGGDVDGYNETKIVKNGTAESAALVPGTGTTKTNHRRRRCVIL